MWALQEFDDRKAAADAEMELAAAAAAAKKPAVPPTSSVASAAASASAAPEVKSAAAPPTKAAASASVAAGSSGAAASSASAAPKRARRKRLLDIGAGNGRITGVPFSHSHTRRTPCGCSSVVCGLVASAAHAAALCDEVVCTEVSGQMVKRLKARGYEY
jgi:hypothetical protein